MSPAQLALTVSAGLFAGLLVCIELGYRIGHRVSQKVPGTAHQGVGAIEAATFALLGLLLGFSFSSGISRLEARRELIAREANTISTAYLRLDLLPTSDQHEIRQLFRQYLDARLHAYDSLPDRKAAEPEFQRASQIQQEIWSRAVIATQFEQPCNTVRFLLLPALNDMMDVTTLRTLALDTHLPGLILFLLISVALLSGLLAGYAMTERKTRSLLHMFLLAAAVSVTVYVVLDLEYPRSGLIRLEAADSLLVQLRDSIQ